MTSYKSALRANYKFLVYVSQNESICGLFNCSRGAAGQVLKVLQWPGPGNFMFHSHFGRCWSEETV
jgi:hypothetical protein